MTAKPFQRARKPEERAERRKAILAAAAALFDAEGPAGAGLNAIAARAGFSKSNVYRYFESREAVLIELFLDEFERLTVGLETGLARCPISDIPKIAACCADQFVAQPRLGALLSILSGVLEENVSETAVIALKRALLAKSERITAALYGVLPSVPRKDCAWATNLIGVLVAGMWPGAHPGSVPTKVLDMPEFKSLKPDIEHDLGRAIATILRGLATR